MKPDVAGLFLAVLMLLVLIVAWEANPVYLTNVNIGISVTKTLSHQNDARTIVWVIVRCGLSGSAWMRAVQMKNALPFSGYNTRVLSDSEFRDEYCADDESSLRPEDIVVFVKAHAHRKFAEMVDCVQAKGAFAVADVVDDWTSPIKEHVRLDAVVFSNMLHASHQNYAQKTRRSWIVPHHHSNFDGVVNTFAGSVRTVGTSSGVLQRMPAATRHALKTWARMRNVHFVEHFFVEKVYSRDGEPLGLMETIVAKAQCVLMGNTLPNLNYSVYVQNGDIHRAINDIDVAIIVPDRMDKEHHDEALAYRPNTRMTMFHSHGIPVVSVPYESYREINAQYGLPSLFFNETHEMLDMLDTLLDDPRTFARLKEQTLHASAAFSLDAIARHYEAYLLTLHH
jgi:hypothetical protein